MEDKITLDKTAFKALASETRVALLKKLGSRRATPSELAQSLGVTPQAASEHLAQLEKAGLAKRDARPEDEGRKWVYYSLTDKGRALVSPSEKRKIWVLLGTGALALALGFSRFFLQPPGFQSASSQVIAPAVAPGAIQATADALAGQVFITNSKALEAGGSAGADALRAAANASVSPLPLPSPSSFFEAASSPCANCGGATPLELVLIVAGCLLIGASFYFLLKSRKTR
jgi:DNA-binding transcriptional ArsR family regulator